MTAYDKFAIVSAALCGLGGTVCAVVRSYKIPRLATAMKFFAFSWAVLIPFYTLQPHLKDVQGLGVIAEFLPTYAGVLLLATAEPLFREAVSRGATMGWGLRLIDYVSAHCLLALIFPYAVALWPEGPGSLAFMRWLDLILAGAGFACIAVALGVLVDGFWKSGLGWGFLFVSAVYFGAQTWWVIDFVTNPQDAPMKNAFIVAFAVLKLALSAVFLVLVMLVRRPQETTPDKSEAAAAPHS